MSRLRSGFGVLGILMVMLGCLVSCSDSSEVKSSAELDHPWFVARFPISGGKRSWKPGDGSHISVQERPGMLIYEVTQFPGRRVWPVHGRAAKVLLEASLRAAQAPTWYDYKSGLASGYALQFNDEAHYVNREFLFDDGLLDPNRPEFLMYYDTSVGKRLVGFMFYVQEALAHGPQVGGRLTNWHFHVWSKPRCFVRGLHAIDIPNRHGDCKVGEPLSRSPEMLHVWLVDHPEGPFATRMRLDPMLLERLVDERGY
ncbi:MAG: hypothetical protein VX246_10645 [Myxococcota bacterium]|nr:hypothetical protein [Myxococcota bacterium]